MTVRIRSHANLVSLVKVLLPNSEEAMEAPSRFQSNIEA